MESLNVDHIAPAMKENIVSQSPTRLIVSLEIRQSDYEQVKARCEILKMMARRKTFFWWKFEIRVRFIKRKISAKLNKDSSKSPTTKFGEWCSIVTYLQLIEVVKLLFLLIGVIR